MKQALLTTFVLLFASGSSSRIWAQKRVEQIVARVNSDIILKSDLDRELEMLRSELSQDLQGAKLEEAVAAGSKDLLSHLIDRSLLMQVAKDAGLSAEAEVTRTMDQLRTERKLATIEDLERLIIRDLGDVEEFKNDIRAKFLTQQVIDHEVHSRIVITNEEMREFYEANKQKFDRPKGIRLSAIIVLLDRRLPEQEAIQRKKIEEAHAAVKKKGASFEDVAAKYSEVESASKGGDLGFIEGDLNEETEKAVGTLAKGEITGIVALGTDALAIFKVTDKHDGGILPFSLADQYIWPEMMSKLAPPKVREYLTKLRVDGFVEVKEGFVDTGAAPAKP
jgi:peptidyl-prolyl cis-trans isomerase SurA